MSKGLKCPVTTGPEWKALEEQFGKQNAWKLYYQNGAEIPTSKEVKAILNLHPDVLTKFVFEGVELTSNEKSELFGGLKYYFIKNLINDLSSIEDISTLLDDTTSSDKFQQVYEEALKDMVSMLDLTDSRQAEIIYAIIDDYPTSSLADYFEIPDYSEGAHANLILDAFKEEVSNLIKFKEDSDKEQDNQSVKEETKDNWNKESIEQNRKDSFSRAIKLLISGIPKLNKTNLSSNEPYSLDNLDNYVLSGELKLEQPIDQSEANNLLLNVFVNHPANINAYMRTINKERLTNPTIEWIYQKVFDANQFTFDNKTGDITGLVDNTEGNLARASLLVKFISSFSNTKYEFLNQIISGEEIKSQNADTNNMKNRLLREWSSSFDLEFSNTNSKILEVLNDKNITPLNLLQKLGFPVINVDLVDSEKKINVLGASYTFDVTYGKFLDQLKDYLQKGGKPSDVFKQIGKTPSTVNTLATAMIEFAVPYRNDYDNQLYNVEGNMQSSINFNTFQTLTINNMNYVIDLVRDELGYNVSSDKFKDRYLEKLNELYPEILNSWSQDSIFLNEYIARGNKMTMQLIAGTSKNNEGDPTSKLVESDLWSSFIDNTIENTFPAIKHADRSMFPAYSFGYGVTDILSDTPGNFNPTSNWKDVFKEHLYTYLKGELARVRKNRNPNYTSFIANYDKIGKEFLVFSGVLDIFNPDKVHQAKLLSLINSGNINDLINDSFVNSQINKWVDNYLNTTVQEAKKAGINENKLGDGIDKSAASKLEESIKAKPNSFEYYDEVIQIAAAKYFIGAVEQSKLFIGDPAYYKIKGLPQNLDRARKSPNDKESVLIYDIIKRANMQSSTKQVSVVDPITNGFLNSVLKTEDYKINLGNGEEFFYKKDFDGTLTELVIDDPRTITHIAEELLKIYPDNEQVRKAYNNIKDGFEETDGFAIGNLFFAVESIFRTEGITSSRLELMKKELKAINMSKEEIHSLYEVPKNMSAEKYMSQTIRPFTQQKFQYVGPNYTMSKQAYKDTPIDERLGVIAGRKDSYGMLIPSLIKGTALEDLHKFMLRNGIDTIHFSSAAKFGAPIRDNNKHRAFYKPVVELEADGKTTKQIAWGGFNDEPIQDGDKGYLDFAYIGKQNEIAYEIKEKVTDSTQSRKNTLSGIMINGDYPLDFNGTTEEWNNLSEEDKIKQSELYKSVKDYEDTISKLVETLTDELLNRFKIGLNGGGNLSINDGALFANLIRRQAVDRGTPNNILDAITDWVNDQGGLKFIESLSNYPKIQYILTSLVTNNLLVLKRNGTMLAQAPSTGWETGNRTFKEGKVVAGDDLKFYQFEYDKEGNISKVIPAECAMPFPIDKLEGLFKKYDGYEYGSDGSRSPYNPDRDANRSITKAIDLLNADIESGKVEEIRVKGLRIPNQQLSSNDVFKVKRFYYPMYTQSIFVPNEIVVKNGSDFDIDKLSLYLPFLDNEFNTKKTEELEGVKRLQSKLLDIEIKLLLHPKRVARLLTPVVGGELQELSQIAQRRALGTPQSGNQTLTDIFKLGSLVKSTLGYVGGKQGVGVVATWITFHKLIENYNIHLKPENTLPEIFNTPNVLTDKGLKFATTYIKYDKNGKEITQEVEDVLSSLITSQVDIVKDDYSAAVNIVLDTLNPVTYLVLRGVKTGDIINVVNSPIIREYYRLYNKSKAKSITPKQGLKNKKGILEYLQNEYAGNPQELEKLSAWLTVEEQANKITDVKSVLSADTKYLKSPSEVQAIESLYYKITGEEGIFAKEDIDFLMNQTLLTPFIKSRSLISQWFDQLYITKSDPTLRTKFEELREGAFKHIRSKELNNKARQKFDEHFINYLIQNENAKFKGRFNDLFTGDNSIPKRVLRAKKNPAFNNNFLINQLVAQLDNNLGINDKKQIDNLKLYLSKLTVAEANSLSSAFQEIKNVDSKLYDDLVIFNIFQAGISNSTYQLNKVIPYEAQKKALGFLGVFNPEKTITDESIADFYVKFFLNNPNQNPLKPKSENIFAPIKKKFDLQGKLGLAVNEAIAYGNYTEVDEEFTSTTPVELEGGNNAIDYTKPLSKELQAKAKDIQQYLGNSNARTIAKDLGKGISESKEVKLSEPKLGAVALQTNFDRNSVKNDKDYIYLFTDNAGRTSGNNSLDYNSWYSKKYTGAYPLGYPSMTQAVIRGLDNAFPITTMIDDKRTQWTDDKFEQYKNIIDDEINTIKEALPKYKGIKFAAQMPFGKGKISDMKNKAPKIWNYLNSKLLEIGIDNTGATPIVSKEVSGVVEDKNELPGLDNIPEPQC